MMTNEHFASGYFTQRSHFPHVFTFHLGRPTGTQCHTKERPRWTALYIPSPSHCHHQSEIDKKNTKKQHLHRAHQPGEKPVPKGVQFGPRITDAWALGEPWHRVRVPLGPVALRSHQKLVPKPGWVELLHQKYNQGRRKMLKRRCQLLSVRRCQSCVEVIFSRCILIGMFWDVFGFSCALYTFCFGVRDDRDVGR